MNRADAEKLGAMALFGEKYGEWVRVVEVDGVSRELCGGTHVANTAEVGIFKISSEGSSAANVRRVEAITGPAAIDWFREREAQLQEAGELLGNPQDPVAAARRAAEQLKQASAGAEQAQREQLGTVADTLVGEAGDLPGGDGRMVLANVDPRLQANPKQLLELANRVQSKLGGPRSSSSAASSAAKPVSSRWSPRTSPATAPRPARSSARSPRSSAAGVAAATTWRRPAARIPRSSTRRSAPPARRSSGSSAERRMRVLALDHGPSESAARSRTRAAPWRRRYR